MLKRRFSQRVRPELALDPFRSVRAPGPSTHPQIYSGTDPPHGVALLGNFSDTSRTLLGHFSDTCRWPSLREHQSISDRSLGQVSRTSLSDKSLGNLVGRDKWSSVPSQLLGMGNHFVCCSCLSDDDSTEHFLKSRAPEARTPEESLRDTIARERAREAALARAAAFDRKVAPTGGRGGGAPAACRCAQFEREHETRMRDLLS